MLLAAMPLDYFYFLYTIAALHMRFTHERRRFTWYFRDTILHFMVCNMARPTFFHDGTSRHGLSHAVSHAFRALGIDDFAFAFGMRIRWARLL